MPFLPVSMPSLGVSILKSMLARHGIGADIFYGSLLLYKHFADSSEAREALVDYNLLASTSNTGDIFFAPAFWQENGPLSDVVNEYIFQSTAIISSSTVRERAFNRLQHHQANASSYLESAFAARDWKQYKIVGFSSTFAQQISSLWLARRIKATYPQVTIVFGGANCDGEMGRAIMETFPFVDHVIQGEADYAFPLYAKHVITDRKIDAIPGIILRTADGSIITTPPDPVRNLDDLAEPDFSDYFAQCPENMPSEEILLPVETSRGCWWGAKSHCIFCGLNPSTMNFRAKKPDRALNEIASLSKRWEIRRLAAVDNIMSFTFYRDFLPGLAKLNIEIFFETKSNLKEWQIAAFSTAGIRHFQPGLEGLNSRILHIMRKGVNRHQSIETLKWCRTYGVAPLWFYLYQFPGDKAEDYLDDASIMPRLSHLPPPKGLNPVTIDRFSPLYANASEFQLGNLHPTKEYLVAYSGLPEELVARLSYHFESDALGSSTDAYIPTLWAAFSRWKQAHTDGAFLFRLVGDTSTLIIDGRYGNNIRHVYLLSGKAHSIHQAMHTAASMNMLQRLFGTPQVDLEISARDFAITMAGLHAGAQFIDGPKESEELDSFLALLDSLLLVVNCDGMWLNLSTDLIDIGEAMNLGLEEAMIHCIQ
jgi:ribosomal peptide maturation radical SAM protein 1